MEQLNTSAYLIHYCFSQTAVLSPWLGFSSGAMIKRGYIVLMMKLYDLIRNLLQGVFLKLVVGRSVVLRSVRSICKTWKDFWPLYVFNLVKSVLQQGSSRGLVWHVNFPYQHIVNGNAFIQRIFDMVYWNALYNSTQWWDRTSSCKGASVIRYQSIHNLTPPTQPPTYPPTKQTQEYMWTGSFNFCDCSSREIFRQTTISKPNW